MTTRVQSHRDTALLNTGNICGRQRHHHVNGRRRHDDNSECECYQSLTAHQHQKGHTMPKQVITFQRQFKSLQFKHCTVWEHSLSGQVWTKCPTRPDTQATGRLLSPPRVSVGSTNKHLKPSKDRDSQSQRVFKITSSRCMYEFWEWICYAL